MGQPTVRWGRHLTRARASRRVVALDRTIERESSVGMDALGEAGAVARGHARSLLSHCPHGAAHTADDGHGGSAGVSMRFVAWTVNLLLAVTLLIAAVRTWPPPVRVFPRRKPLLGVPWCVMGGYGACWDAGCLRLAHG